jgi:hypothetical protein
LALVAEVPKDLVNRPLHAIREHLPQRLSRLEQVVRSDPLGIAGHGN